MPSSRNTNMAGVSCKTEISPRRYIGSGSKAAGFCGYRKARHALMR